MAVESTIQNLLFSRLASLVLSPTLPIAWPNVAFTPPTGPYLRVSYLPNTTTRLLIKDGGFNQYMGILQVSAVYAVGQGEIAPRKTAEKVADHFNDTLRIPMAPGNIRVMKHPDIGSAIQEADRIQVPVTIQWVAYA